MERENKYITHSCLEWSAEDVERMITMQKLDITLSEQEMLDVAYEAIDNISDMMCAMIHEDIYEILCRKIEEKK